MKLSSFKHGKKYIVTEDYENIPEPFFRTKTMCYCLIIGQILTFETSNLGYARFRTKDGRLVLLEPKTAFRVIGRVT